MGRPGHVVMATPERALFVISVAWLSLIAAQSSPLLFRHPDDQNRSEDPLASGPRVLQHYTQYIRGRGSVSNVAMSKLAATITLAWSSSIDYSAWVKRLFIPLSLRMCLLPEFIEI